MIRFLFKCLCSFSLLSTLYAAPTSNGIHRVSRQDYTSYDSPQGAAASYQRPFESQNGVYRVQRQDFTNANDIPFHNSYQSPYMNRFSAYNSAYGNTNRSYVPYPKLFVPASPSRPENPYLAIGLPNYNRVVPASSFQARTQAPQVTVYYDDSVLPALPHPPRHDLSSVQQKASSFEEDFSSAVEQFDMTEDRKTICKGANCRKFDPNDDADAVKPIRRRRSIDFEPLPGNSFGKPYPYINSGYNRPLRRYNLNRYPMHSLDDYEYDGMRPPRVYVMREFYNSFGGERTTVEPTTTEFLANAEESETTYSVPDSNDYEIESTTSIDERTSTPEPPAESTTTPLENDFNAKSDDQEFTDEFSQRVTRSEEATTSRSKPTELEFEYNESYAPLPTIDSGSTNLRDDLVVDYPTGDNMPEDHPIHSTEPSTEWNLKDVDYELSSVDCQFRRETVEPTTDTDITENQPEDTSETYTTEEQPENPTTSDYQAEDHSIDARESSTDSDLDNEIDDMNFKPIECEFSEQTTEPVTEPEPTPETETETTEQQTEYSPNNEIMSYSLSILIICRMWPEKYNKSLTDLYNENDQSWTSVCNSLNLGNVKDIEPEPTTTEAADTDFVDESAIFGIGVETIGEDFQNLLEVIEQLQIGNTGDDIWPELPETDYDK